MVLWDRLASVPDVCLDASLRIYECCHLRWGLERMASTSSGEWGRKTMGDRALTTSGSQFDEEKHTPTRYGLWLM